jgi:hypothetical protein
MPKVNIRVLKGNNGDVNVYDGEMNIGIFERLPDEDYSYYPKLQHKLTGDHYIAAGEALNTFNKAYNANK